MTVYSAVVVRAQAAMILSASMHIYISQFSGYVKNKRVCEHKHAHFPAARIKFSGPRKNTRSELFCGQVWPVGHNKG